ncbi:MAG: thioredoxin-dependent thiol peroxidase [Bacteroidales bacterium]
MTVLQKGDKAPSFSAKDEQGNPITIDDYQGKKLILFFYPKASTPGCTAEACNLRDYYKELEEKGFALLGVSADSPKRQQNFKAKNNLPYPLIPDVDKEIINAYGVWGPKKFMGKEYEGINRTTFVIDEEGKIEEIISKVKTKNHAEQIIDKMVE